MRCYKQKTSRKMSRTVFSEILAPSAIPYTNKYRSFRNSIWTFPILSFMVDIFFDAKIRNLFLLTKHTTVLIWSRLFVFVTYMSKSQNTKSYLYRANYFSPYPRTMTLSNVHTLWYCEMDSHQAKIDQNTVPQVDKINKYWSTDPLRENIRPSTFSIIFHNKIISGWRNY